MNQQVATELLESAGAVVNVANHGGEAVRDSDGRSRPAEFDVVLMDLQMPEMDGYHGDQAAARRPAVPSPARSSR